MDIERFHLSLFQNNKISDLLKLKGLAGDKFNPSPDDKFLDSSKLKEFADDNFKFDENGSKLSKRVENIVGKGEIARYEQFFLFPRCFQKVYFPGASKGVIVWEWVKLTIKTKFVINRIENIVGKGKEMLVSSIFSFSQNVFKGLCGKGLNLYHTIATCNGPETGCF